MPGCLGARPPKALDHRGVGVVIRAQVARWASGRQLSAPGKIKRLAGRSNWFALPPRSYSTYAVTLM